jgi:type IV pilus assembly protein PilY1
MSYEIAASEARLNRPNRSTRRSSIALATLAALATTLLVSAPARAQCSTTSGTTFDSGSLIIPMSSSWQDACGSVSAYGLIYDLLRANDGLTSYPASSGQKFTQPIYVHWVYATTKSSPNRCVPTNQSALYNGSTAMSGQSTASCTVWNDGCDFSVDNSVANNFAPVTVVTNTDTTLSSSNDKVATTLDTTDSGTREYPSGVGPLLAFPNFRATAVTVTANLLTTVNLVRYGGGAFVIAASDAPAFLALLSGKESHKDSLGNTIDFSPFRTKGTVSSSTSKTNGCAIIKSSTTTPLAAFSSYDNGNGFGTAGTTPGGGNQLAYANEHYVTVHRAATSFTAFDTQKWNTRPPRIGLLQTVGGLFNPESDGTPTTGIKGAQLKYYLKSAGLDFTGASGCPAGGFNATTTVSNSETGSTNTATFCPNGPTPGQIYDYLDAIDVANGALGNYQIFWAPHFQPPCLNATDCSNPPYNGSASSLIPTSCASASFGFSASNTCVNVALSRIGNFLSQQSRGFFGECATIATFEGSYKNSDPAINAGQNFSMADGGVTQALTCISNGAGGCSAVASPQPGLIVNNPTIRLLRLDTCDNPVQPLDETGNSIASKYCIYYNPQYDFAQIGDFRWFAYSGGTENFAPASGAPVAGDNSIYTNGAVRLAYTIANNTGGLTVATGPSLAYVDNFTYAQRNANTAAVVYLAGHNYTSDVAGTRVALNTVLSLGLAVATAETAFVGATLYKGNVFVPSYYEVTTSRPPDAWQTYNPTTGSQWHFPYHAGELRVHALANATVTQNYGDAVVYSASNQFKHTSSGTGASTIDTVSNIPANRNVFTYLAGQVTTNSVPSNIPNRVAQLGWQPVSVDESQITNTSTCVNKFHVGAVTKTFDGGVTKTYAGMVAGDYANGAKVCDLQEALELSVPASAFGIDYGADAGEQTAIAGYFTDQGQINSTVQLVRMVRGYCFSTLTGVDGTSTPTAGPLYSTATLLCNNSVQYGGPATASNAPTLDYPGAFVHSQVAIIPDSPYITNIGGKSRPTVAYVGGLDGMLHAFYVPRGDGLESGYTGPAATPKTLSASSAATVFPTNYAAGFNAATPALTELWAFIPPGQLPFLATNQAQVDSSPVVIDVFGDFNGDGLRTWHTVLVASAGGGNRELFALDITNPLAPILLWDLESSYSASLNYAPIPLTDDDTGFNYPAYNGATLWKNTCRAAQEVALPDGGVPCTPSKYIVPSKNDTAPVFTGVFNYSHLGASQSVSVAELRHNGLPLYAAFVATNEPAGSGVFVFSIDLVTGQKLWEWSSPYDTTNLPAAQVSGIGNNAPAGVTLFSKTGDNLIDTVYVGDDSGNLWELDAEDGASQTGYGVSLNCSNGSCNYALSNAYGAGTNGPQPISTLSTLFYIPTTTASTSQFYNYLGQTLLAYGTGGTDTVSALATVPDGAVHVLPVGASGRYQPGELSGSSALKTLVSTDGVAKEVTGYPQILTNSQRVFGSIVATGDRLYFSATSGSVSNIDNRSSESLQGTLYSVNFNSSTATTGFSALASGNGGIGGTVAVDTSVSGQVTVVTITGQKIVTTVDKGGGSLAPNLKPQTHSINNVNTTPTTLLGWILRKTGHDY